MKIKFIGTGSGKTSLNRFHSSILISVPHYNLLIDCGDSTSRALLNAEIDFNSINGIIFSHLHPDHFSGLGDLLVQMKMGKRKKQLEIFIGKNQAEFVKEFILNSYLFPERRKFNINFHKLENNSKVNIRNEITILPKNNNHLVKLKSYPQYKNLSFDSFSFLFADGKRNIVYTGDIGSTEDLYLFKENKIDLFISESTHITPGELINAHKSLAPGITILTHIADEDEESIHKQIHNFDKGSINIELAFDGFEINP